MICKNECYHSCYHFVKTTKLTHSGNKLILHIPDKNKEYCNKEKICICVAQCIPENVKESDTVEIQIDSGCYKFPMENKYCEFVYANEIHPRTLYYCTIATDTKIFCCHNKSVQCNKCHIFPKLSCCKKEDGDKEKQEENQNEKPKKEENSNVKK